MVFFIAKASRDDLLALMKLIETHQMTPVIDRCLPLRDAAQALRCLKEGHPRGKVVVTIGNSEGT